jgi:hypothetical protein
LSGVIAEIDLFYFFRGVIFLFLAIYTLLAIVSSILRAYSAFAGDSNINRLVRVYASYQLISIRPRRFAGDILQIALLIAACVSVWWLHKLI